uniref:Uncharacterized protein n=1 Tax=Photinus pyralis TaxID=7054 RepID=A0A1Y1MFN4_PHOPY
MVKKTTGTLQETRQYTLKLATSFASYLKHKERGKKDRRAIASGNMILRMFLHIIEEFHLALAKRIEGATISIGGEEKKQKISNNMSTATLPHGPSVTICQGTEDATKWNECLSPSFFALIHKYMFDSSTRIRNALPPTNEMGKLFQKIALAGNFLLSMKKVQLIV